MNKRGGAIMIEALMSLLLASFFVMYSQEVRSKMKANASKANKSLILIKKYILLSEEAELKQKMMLGALPQAVVNALSSSKKECSIKNVDAGFEQIEFGGGLSMTVVNSTINCGEDELVVERLRPQVVLPNLVSI